MAKQYDKIIKENIEQIFLPLAEKYLGINIIDTKNISEKVQITKEREVDFNKIVTTDKGEQFILHMEFQTTDDSDMVYRVAEYKAMNMRKFKMPVRSIVVYFGTDKSKMRTQLKDDEIIKGFELLNVLELDTERILDSEVPEEILLAILGKHPRANAETIIKRVIERLQSICDNEMRLQKYIQQLIVLSRLRNLEVETKNQVEHMPITYDITKDGLFLEGKKEGKKEERKKRALEIAKKNKEIAKNLKKAGVDIAIIAESTGLKVEEIQKL